VPPVPFLIQIVTCFQTNSKDERDALQFIHTLELKDMLVKSSEERSENWTPSSKLAVRAFLVRNTLIPLTSFTEADSEIHSCFASASQHPILLRNCRECCHRKAVIKPSIVASP
jgi:hypothetical protein